MDTDYNSGVYLLEIYLSKEKEIEVGSKGIYSFPSGYYYYTGSAQRNLKSRLERHQRSKKKLHWHIDYLLEEGDLVDYLTWPEAKEAECDLSDYLKDELNGQVICPGFGASDCHCETHLYYFPSSLELTKVKKELF